VLQCCAGGSSTRARPSRPDIASLARGFGCNAVQVETTDQLEKEFTTALDSGGPTVIVVMTKPEKTAL